MTNIIFPTDTVLVTPQAADLLMIADDSDWGKLKEVSVQWVIDLASNEPTLIKPIINGSIQWVTANSDWATITFDLATANVHTVTLWGNRTLALSNVATWQVFTIRLLQDATGGRTVTWFTTIKRAGWTPPTLTATASKADTLGFVCTGSGTYDWFIIWQNI